MKLLRLRGKQPLYALWNDVTLIRADPRLFAGRNGYGPDEAELGVVAQPCLVTLRSRDSSAGEAHALDHAWCTSVVR